MNSISIDCLFAVNFALDFLALRLCTTVLRKERYDPRTHYAAALLIAALECASCVFPRYLPSILIAAISFLTVALLFYDITFAFLYSGLSLWTGLLLTFMMKFFKGVLPMNEIAVTQTQFDKNKVAFAALTLITLVFLKLHFDKLQKRSSKATLEVVYKSKKAKLSALRDSGNLLRDPLSGRPVAVLSKDAAKKLGMSEGSVMDAASGVRVIPIKSVGYTGILYAFVPQSTLIDGKKRNICIALDPKNTDFSGFDAIIPSNM